MAQQDLKCKLLNTSYFIGNEYLDKYCELIINNLETQKEKFKTERHHIFPKCYFKEANLKIVKRYRNLVNLLYKDHILAHYYLALCVKENTNLYYKLNNAFDRMAWDKYKTEDFNPEDLDHYQEIHEINCKYSSERNKGKKLSEETKQKMRKPKPEGFGGHLKYRKGIKRPPDVVIKMKKPKGKQSEETKIKKSLIMKDKCNKPIICIETGIIYGSIQEASKTFNTKGIPNCLRDVSKTSVGYHWALVEDELKVKELTQLYYNKPREDYFKDKLSIKVQCIETGEIFNSIKEAQTKYKCDISSYLAGNQKCAGRLIDGTKLHWKKL